MISTDPKCRICGARQSEHVVTAKSQFTHPREARGEGVYVLKGAGTFHLGPGQPDVPWERWEFVPPRRERCACRTLKAENRKLAETGLEMLRRLSATLEPKDLQRLRAVVEGAFQSDQTMEPRS
jgi:hypothetical protein